MTAFTPHDGMYPIITTDSHVCHTHTGTGAGAGAGKP